MTNTKTKVTNINEAHRIRMIRELKSNGPLPVAYLTAKYTSDIFVDALMAGEIFMDDNALVYCKSGK
jgi:hypothetical protein